MAGTWSPDAGTPLFGGSEAAAVDIIITYVPDTTTDPTATPPTGYSAAWITSPIPSLVTITGDVSGLHLSGPNATGMAPIGIDYVTDKVSYHIVGWDALPDSAQEIYHFTAPGTNIVTAQLQVSAIYGTGAPVVQVFTFQATIDYSSGRDRLVLEINKRR